MKSVGLVLVTFVLALCVACGGGDDGESETDVRANWAAQFCGIAQEFQTAFAAVSAAFPGEASTMPLEQRKARSKGLSSGHVTAAKKMADDLAKLTPPPDARDYHSEQIATGKALASTIAEEDAKIQTATSATAIEASNARLGIVLNERNEASKKAAQKLEADTIAALTGIQKCGGAVT